MNKKVLLVGLHPDVVDYAKWPDLTPEKLARGLEAERSHLSDLGLNATWTLIRDGETGAQTLKEQLTKETYDVALIVAGVGKDEDHFLVFERLVNIIHEHAPQARIAFNTNPFDTAAAIQRWTQAARAHEAGTCPPLGARNTFGGLR